MDYSYWEQIRPVNNDGVNKFIAHLTTENCELVLSNHYVHSLFNSSLNIFLRISGANFSTKTSKMVFENNEYLAKGTQISCKHKQDLYLYSWSSNNELMTISLQEIFLDFNSSH